MTDELQLLREVFQHEVSPDARATEFLDRQLQSAFVGEKPFSVRSRSRLQTARIVRPRLALIAAAAVILVGGVVVSVSGVGTQSVASASPFHVASYVTIPGFQASSQTIQFANTVTCPTSTDCYLEARFMDGESAAPGNNVYFSSNGGNSWQQLTLPAGVYANTALSCSTNQQCSFGGGQFSGVDSNGKPLMDPVLVSTANAGASWNVEKLPLPTNGAFELLGNVYVSSLQCFSASNCDVILLASFGVNFGRPDYSYVEDNVFMQTTDGGHSWSSVILPGQPAPNSSTALSDVGPINVNAMSCPSTQLCIASTSVSFAHGNSSIVWRTDNGGATWTVGSLPNGLTSVGPISCPDTQHCWIVAWPTSGGIDSQLLESSDGGASWINRSPQGLPRSTTWDTASCPTDNNCWLAGKTQGPDSAAVVYATSDAGQTWNAASLPTEVGAETAPLKGIDTIGCNADLTCIVLGIPQGVSEDGVNEAVLTNAAGH